ncbi:MAG TPA: hypothetical protein PKZ32_02370 [Candidatus Melainabacteria bacterium]|nr:hypothetical protein [Candidatus Melainabacteria bacterium]
MQAVSRSGGFPAGDRPSEAAIEEGPYPWILHPAIDLLFCCGGMLWFLIAVIMLFGHSSYQTAAGQFVWYFGIFGNFLLADAHAPATYFRIYNTPELREKMGLPCILTGVAFFCLGLVCLFNESWAGFFYRVWMFWIIQHFLAQSYGITLLYCIKRGFFLDNFEKRILWLLYQITLVYACLLTCPVDGRERDTFFELKIPFFFDVPNWVMVSVQSLLAVCALAFVGICVRKYMKDGRVLPFPAALTIVSSIVFFATALASNPILTVLLGAFYHGSQYLVVSASSHLKQCGLPDGVSFHRIATQLSSMNLLRWYGMAVGIGLIVWLVLPRVIVAFGFGLGLVIASIQACYSFHHFLLDAYIWKLRDPKLRKQLVA